MYNKLFTKILHSSIWLEDAPTRIVWITLIAAMDEDGFAMFSAIGNVASAARVTQKEAEKALAIFQRPDAESGNPANEGRRVERVPGGWLVLNAKEHRDLVTRAAIQEQTRERVQKHRERKRNAVNVTDALQAVTGTLPAVTCNTSETVSKAEAGSDLLSLGDRKQSDQRSSNGRADESQVARAVTPSHRDVTPMNLHNGSDVRLHGTHAWCSWPERAGFCIVHSMHQEFIGKSAKPEEAVKAWYVATMTKFKGVPIGEDSFHFWRNEFAGWIGVATVKPSAKRQIGVAPGAGERMAAHFAAKGQR